MSTQEMVVFKLTFYHDLDSCMNINIILFGDTIYFKISKSNLKKKKTPTEKKEIRLISRDRGWGRGGLEENGQKEQTFSLR